MLEGLPPLRDVISQYGLAAKRSLGQHFLLDPNLLDRIVRSAGDLAGRHVVEVGPGPGGLTRALLGSAAASVTSVELDDRAVAALQDVIVAAAGRFVLVPGDALRRDLAALVPAPRQIIANLPYNIGAPLLVGWLRQAAAWERLTLMFQLEVAERICAAPDTPDYGRLSVLAQWICTTDIALRVPPEAFVPRNARVVLIGDFLAPLEQIQAAEAAPSGSSRTGRASVLAWRKRRMAGRASL